MKHKVLAMAALLLAACGMQAQTRVERFNIPADSNSIIRTVDSSHVLVYTEETPGCFLLYVQGSNIAKAFRVDPKWKIHDVRVWNGTDAYFCGTAGGQALIGMFPIFPTFSSTGGAINYATIDWSQTQGAVLPTDLKRLDLFYDNGVVNMAMVGESLFNREEPMRNTTVTSAWFDGTDWHTCSYVNKGRYMDHTDIACLDSVIVSVGTDTNRHGCYMKTFQKVQDFPRYPLALQEMYEVSYGSPVGEALVTHESQNFALVAQFNKTNSYKTVLHSIELSTATGAPTGATIGTWESFPPATVPYSPTWKMLELNVIDKDVWLLQRASYSTSLFAGVHDWLQSMRPSTAGMISKSWLPLHCDSYSMDIKSETQYPWLSGGGLSLIVYCPQWTLAGGTCHEFLKIPYIYAPAVWHAAMIDDGYEYYNRTGTEFKPEVIYMRVNLLCEQ